MQNRTDSELLRDYTAHGSDAAFAEIVRRYADFVYSAAARQVGNSEQARDVAQNVFADLARKAISLKTGTVVIGWLCNAVRLASLEQLRSDQRRLERERLSMDLLHSSAEVDLDWNAVQPVLDEAISRLGVEDRNALLLRFFHNESLVRVGTALGVSEDAAQKRVSRALEKLREMLSARGIRTTSAALSASLFANAVHSAPAGLAASLATSALAPIAAQTAATSTVHLFTTFNMKTGVLLLAFATTIAVLTLKQVNARRELQAAHALANQRQDALKSLQETNALLQSRAAALERFEEDATDVLRLRAEVARLRGELAERAVASAAATIRTNADHEIVEPQIQLQCKFLLGPDGPGGALGVLDESQARTVLESLRNTTVTTVISEGNVTTLSGRQAQIQFSDADLASAGYADAGSIIDLIPTCPPGSQEINLEFAAYIRAFVHGRSEDQPGEVRVVGLVTNSLPIANGHTLLISRRISPEGPWTIKGAESANTGPRTLFLLVTPTLIDPAGNSLFPAGTADIGSNAVLTVPRVFPGGVPGQ